MQSPPLYPPTFHTNPSPPPPRVRKNPRTVSIPQNVGPFVRLVFSEMARQVLRFDDVAYYSGVNRAAMKTWRKRSRPGLENLEAVLSVLGYAFVPVPALEVLPPDIAGAVTELALKLEKDIPTTWAALIDIGVEQKLLHMSAEERRAIFAEREARIPPSRRRRRRTSH